MNPMVHQMGSIMVMVDENGAMVMGDGQTPLGLRSTRTSFSLLPGAIGDIANKRRRLPSTQLRFLKQRPNDEGKPSEVR
jgi:hypothetical protein